MEDRPRLPLEILEQIVLELRRPCSLGDPVAQRTLSALSLVSRTVRHWALAAKYSVVVAPRHVREFRKWHGKVHEEMVGYNRALFVALDDVSKLTSTSAGWEPDLQRFLQRLGPNLTHLSLWTSETRAVLRDPAQIRGPRVRNRMPIQTMDDVISNTRKRRHKVERRIRKMRLGKWSDPNSRPLKADRERDEAQTRAEVAAARERARQKIPKWLQWELETKREEEVKRAYKAHLGTTVREYQHELDVQSDSMQHAPEKVTAEEPANVRSDSSCSLTGSEESASSSSSSDSDDDNEIDWGCMPIKLSICPALPLHEHENALNFARMTIWTRVEELDVFIAVPADVRRYLELLSSLAASPLAKFRLSSIYATLLITVQPSSSGGAPSVNLANGLAEVMRSEALSQLLGHEFNNKHMEDIAVLEGAMASVISAASSSEQDIPFDEQLRTQNGLHSSQLQQSSTGNGHDGPVRVTILQGNQAYWGKLKDRRMDFLERSLSPTNDCWSRLMK